MRLTQNCSVLLVGNRRFRICIDNNLDSYMKASTRQEKSSIISSIVKTIHDGSIQNGGGFVAKVRRIYLRYYWIGTPNVAVLTNCILYS
jgi:hypothetical protein